MLTDQERGKLAKKIEECLPRVKDESSFLQELLMGALDWPIPANGATTVDELGYAHLPQGRQTPELDRKVLDIVEVNLTGTGNQPWGVFILRFKDRHVFDADRGMTGALRELLRDLVPKRVEKTGDRRSWGRENLLFICTFDYTQFRFAYFKKPEEDKSRQARLAAFGWHAGSSAVRTVCEFNLSHLGWPETAAAKAAWVDHWADAFDVEKVTKRFYTDYAAEFTRLQKAIKGVSGEDLKMFTQTLMNRLMFLRFIERKGWLTPPGAATQSKDYLRLLFAAGGYRGKSFYNGRLRKLFFEGLAVEGKQESDAIGKVPFLNGGLFEELELDKKVADIDDKAFASLLGEDGLFYRYNFTVLESTPLNVEVAVDPEMLGKVFEELVTGRHESGSYYTPRNVVSFMCREALKGYLAHHCNFIPPADIEKFVDRHDASGLTIPAAKEVAKALDEVRAVDPACGSGAYLLGLLHEMIDLYQLLYSDKLKNSPRAIHAIKLDIIEKSLYGTDIDRFATSIAMLRLWLSLSVDTDVPQALPNLDFKVETGNSVTGPNPQAYIELFLTERARKLAELKGEYMRSSGAEKKALRQQVEKKQENLAFELRSLSPGSIDWRVQFCEVFFSERSGFDIVLANPPYIRQELIKNIKPLLKKVYGKDFSATADLYVFFYLRSLQLLARGGMMVFISSNKWFRAGYGESLRNRFLKESTVRLIIDFHDLPVFQSADAYPMIFIAAKGQPDPAHVSVHAKPLDLASPYPDVLEIVKRRGHPIPAARLSLGIAWEFDSKANARTEANGFFTIEKRFGKDIYYGIKTGLTEAFVIDAETRASLIENDSRSGEILAPFVRGRDIERWTVKPTDRWLVLSKQGGSLKRYPAVAKHLEGFRKKLEARDDQGDYWWQLRPCTYYHVFERPHIVYQVFQVKPVFALAPAGSYAVNSAYVIASEDRFLLGVLNSQPFWTEIKRTCSLIQNGYQLMYSYFKNAVIPDPEDKERRVIEGLVNRCLAAHGKGCEAWEKEIDERVAALYENGAADRPLA